MAAATLGMRVRSTKVLAFALSGFIAGCAGALFGGFSGAVQGSQFDPVNSLVDPALRLRRWHHQHRRRRLRRRALRHCSATPSRSTPTSPGSCSSRSAPPPSGSDASPTAIAGVVLDVDPPPSTSARRRAHDAPSRHPTSQHRRTRAAVGLVVASILLGSDTAGAQDDGATTSPTLGGYSGSAVGFGTTGPVRAPRACCPPGLRSTSACPMPTRPSPAVPPPSPGPRWRTRVTYSPTPGRCWPWPRRNIRRA